MKIQRSAILSADGLHRYILTRTWSGESLVAVKPLGFVMLNPSTADANQDDPTIRRCSSFALREGFGGIEVANLFSWRATDPRDLAIAMTRDHQLSVSCSNEHLHYLAGRCPTIVLAWGALRCAWMRSRAEAVIEALEKSRLVCLGRTKAGDPRHPLFVRSDALLEAWR
jgi:hypothetical protein